LTELEIDSARRTIMCLVVFGRKDVEDDEGEIVRLSESGSVRECSVVFDTEVFVPVK